jgi:hypothetical protein
MRSSLTTAGSTAPARRARVLPHRSAVTAAVLLYYIVVDPLLCASATHARYALGGSHLRMPWQAGVRQVLVTLLAHLAAENALPLRIYVPNMTVRATVPLAARAAESLAGGAAAAVAHSRLLTKHFAWDAAHAGVVLLCVAHAARAAAARRQARLDAAAAATNQEHRALAHGRLRRLIKLRTKRLRTSGACTPTGRRTCGARHAARRWPAR